MNYKQSELGDLLGVSNKAVSRWENGESFPDVGVLESLAATLDISIQDILMIFSFGLILVGNLSQDSTSIQIISRFDKWSKIVALVSILWIIIMTWCMFIMTINGHIPFGMEMSSVGPFINWQLVGLFSINIIILILQLFRFWKYDEIIHWGWFVSISGIYLSVLYSDLLHRMNSTQGVIESLAIRTVVTLLITGLFLYGAKKEHSAIVIDEKR